jgi:pimeloyl-ACP methyl ester carboxylesterase
LPAFDSEEKAMKKRRFFLGSAGAILLLLTWLAGCQMPNQPAGKPPEEALSYDQLLSNLDALQGPATWSLASPGQSVFPTSRGRTMSTQDLSTYISAIKTQLAAYVYSITKGKTYLVVPKKLSWSFGTGRESGLMWVPFTWFSSKSFPIIALQHGTQVYQDSAPSRFNANPLSVLASPDQTGALQNYVECIVGALMASAGYIVVMPDYAGFGDSTVPDHPYVRLELGNSVRDIVQQALGLAGWVTSNGKVFLTGYSEGGYATMAGARALQQAGILAKATVACDGAYDLSGVMRNQMVFGTDVKMPSYLLYTASGYRPLFEGAGVPVTGLLRSDPLPGYPNGYAGMITTPNLFDGTHTDAEIGALPLPHKPSDMLVDGEGNVYVASGGQVTGILASNNAWVGWSTSSASVWIPTGFVVFIHCRDDDVVPYENATVARQIMYSAAAGAYGSEQASKLVPPVMEVPDLPLVEQIMGSIHIAAYPTAMLAAFTAIQAVNQLSP